MRETLAQALCRIVLINVTNTLRKIQVYNNPFDEPGFGFGDGVDFARQALDGDAGFFSGVYL
jgi:hypothetical protein